MATITKPYSFTQNTLIKSAEVNSDLDTLYGFVQTSVSHVDGSQPFTGIPSLPATDPTTDNQAVRKKYVDDRTKGVLATHVVVNPSNSSGVSNAYGAMGVAVSFTMPTLGSGRAIRLTLSWPGLVVALATDGALTFAKSTDSATRVPGSTRSLAPSTAFGGTQVGFILDNTVWTAGSTANIWVFGRSSTTDAWNLSGSAQNPIVFVAELV